MTDLTFNIYAMAKPSTPKEYMALLDEALRMAVEIGEQLDSDTSIMEMRAVAAQ